MNIFLPGSSVDWNTLRFFFFIHLAFKLMRIVSKHNKRNNNNNNNTLSRHKEKQNV